MRSCGRRRSVWSAKPVRADAACYAGSGSEPNLQSPTNDTACDLVGDLEVPVGAKITLAVDAVCEAAGVSQQHGSNQIPATDAACDVAGIVLGYSNAS